MDATGDTPEITAADQEAAELLAVARQGVLTLATGGCARYAFSFDMPFCLDRRGSPLLFYASGNPHHHVILTNTTLSLRLPHHIDPDGTEQSLLLLNGRMHLVDPGDHDSLDRHYRYFEQDIENFTRGERRLYRLRIEQAFFESFDGAHTPVAPARLLRRNPFAPARERTLIVTCQRLFDAMAPGPDGPRTVVGLDSAGIDFRDAGGIRRWSFPVAVSSGHEVEAALASAGILTD
jgi:hypothetical protein